MTESPGAQAQGFLERYVSVFNAAARTGDFSQFVTFFADDAVLEFDGVPNPPISGIADITQHYRDDPPDDQVNVIRWKRQDDRIMAEFRWSDIPEATGGCFVIELRGEKVAHLTVAFGGPASRCFR